jgi:hypothetical protein
MLTPGARLGPYEIVSPLGAGGMGEVYRARDTKLGRDVAIKVLPAELASNPDALARFEREARAVAQLSHPGILAIFDFGRDGETAYAVTELLDGETLRARLAHGALPARKAVELAAQMAEGLAAAHEKGIVHRDLKPENVFVTHEGRAKLLDFGLAKRTGSAGDPGMETTSDHTGAGTVLGTAGYMSPEQVRGESVDHRSDIFSFGAVLYEMLTGRRAFGRETGAESMTAILKEDPPEIATSATGVSPALQRIVQHCLEKRPGERFQSARDIAFALQALSGSGPAPSVATSRPAAARRRAVPGAVACLVLGAGLTLLLGAVAHVRHWPPFAPPGPPTFQRLTFLPGTIESARFGPDGRTVYFSERVAGGKPEIFVLHPGDSEPRPTGIQDALLLAVSASNELAFLRGPRLFSGHQYGGILARAPGGGGAPREVQADIAEAVWDGDGLATLTGNFGGLFSYVSFPAGKQILTVDAAARIVANLRISPDGERLALTDSSAVLGRTEIVVYDRTGHRQSLFVKPGDTQGDTLTGLAWGPGGELWVSELQEGQTALWALSLAGRLRPMWRGQGALQLLDVSPEGRLLLAQHQVRRGVLAQRAGEAAPRDLSILGSTQVMGLSADGRSVLLVESPSADGATAQDVTYLRPLAGGPALRLGRGWPNGLSADGRWVHLDAHLFEARDLDPAWVAALQEAGLAGKDLGNSTARGRFLLFVPAGMGKPFALALPLGADSFGNCFPLADARRVVAMLGFKGMNHWVLLDRQGGSPVVIAPEIPVGDWVSLVPVSPDGTRLIISEDGETWLVQPISGGERRPILGMLPRERPVGWTADGTGVYVRPELSVLPVTIARLDLASGARTQVMSFTPPDPAGHVQTRRVCVTPDASAFAFSYEKKLSELYLVEGLK